MVPVVALPGRIMRAEVRLSMTKQPPRDARRGGCALMNSYRETKHGVDLCHLDVK